VVISHEDPAIDGLAGTVTGRHRNRVGVEINDGKGTGKIIGVPSSCLKTKMAEAHQKFSVGDEIEIKGGDVALLGKTGRVAGFARGRVGVTLGNGDQVGVPGDTLVKVQAFAEQNFKVGTEVTILHDGNDDLNGKTGFVTGTHRNRVGVEIGDGLGGKAIVGVPITCLRAMGKSAAQKFSVGDEVEVTSQDSEHTGKFGRVTGLNRGRVGIALRDGSKIGLVPEDVRRAGKDPAQAFQVGMEVEIVSPNQEISGLKGTVAGRNRGRIGVKLPNGESIGVLPAHLRNVPQASEVLFGAGDEVLLIAGPHKDQSGRVSGTARGRVGVDLPNGTRIGVPPDQLKRLGKSAAQEFTVGTVVEVVQNNDALLGERGVVSGSNRGRVGVELFSGKCVGVPPDCLRKAPPEAEDYPVGSRVVITRQQRDDCGAIGTVQAHHRGRVAIELDDEGGRVGLPPDQIRMAPADPRLSFPEGTKVFVVSKKEALDGEVGVVMGHSRGRVGVELADGSKIGVTPCQLRKVPTEATDFPMGSRVEIYLSGSPDEGAMGPVVGHSRGRVCVELEEGRRVGIPAGALRPVPTPLDEIYPDGTEVQYTKAPGAKPQKGKVTGRARGRVGLELEDGSKVGAPPSTLKKA